MHVHGRLLPRALRRLPVLVALAIAAALLPLGLAASAAPSAPKAPTGRVDRAGVPASSSTADFPAWSLIVDLGASPQSVSNGLKPYGFVYELLTTYKVPVSWGIKNGKSAMGAADFTATNLIDLSTNASVASKTFTGSSFIVSGSFAGDIPMSRITYWKGQGVKMYVNTAPMTGLPEFSLLRSWPRIVLDADSSAVADNYYANAGIPSSAYRTALPSALTACDDLFVFPHADPTWALHKNLKSFNQTGGYIFGQCHAASVLENIDDPNDAGTAPDLNFLSETGLVMYDDHSDGTLPYSYHVDWSDPVMQITNNFDAATQNGSEQVYLPKTGGWRPTSKVLAWDPDHPQLIGGSGTDLSPGKAAVSVYGRGFGNAGNGLVMYQASHDYAKATTTANIAAQRTFLNFNLLAGIDRSPVATATVPSAPITAGATIAVSSSATGGSGTYTYKWTSSCGGTFANSTAAGTTFTAPALASSTACTLRVTVTDSCGRVSFDARSVPVNPPPPPAPSISLEKSVADSADADSVGSLGETLTYSFSVTNTGNVPLSNVKVTDTKLGLSGAPCVASLAVGETKSCPAKTYVVTAADIDQGSVHNTATASATPSSGSDVTATDDATIATPAQPGIQIVKSVADSGDADAVGSLGETLTYTFTVTNTGNVPLTNVKVTDTKLGLNGATCVAGLAVGQTATCPAKTYVVTAADVTNGSVDNVATITGTPSSGPAVSDTDDANMPTQSNQPSLHLEKSVADSADAGTAGQLGETLTFTFSVTNTGNVPITNVTISDPKLGLSGATCVAGLAVGETKSCPAKTYVVTAADIAAGSVHNVATVTGTPATGGTISDEDDATISTPAQPGIEVDKMVADSADADTIASLGETLTYTFKVTNTGNVPLTDVTLTDPKLGLTNATCVATLAVGASAMCPAKTYLVTSGDIGTGSVQNTATVTGKPITGGTVTHTDSTSIPTEGAAPSTTIQKSVVDSGDADSIASLGETLTYTFTVKNTGNVELTNVTVTDAKLGMSNVACVPSLAVGATATCPLKTYTVTAADLAHGSVDNTATVTAKPPTGGNVTNQGSATIPTDAPTMTMTKSVADADPSDSMGTEGEVLTYSFTVTNTGNVDLVDVTITDPMIPGLASGAACVASLPVGQTTSCPLLPAATHTVTAADVAHGSVDNTATGTGTSPSDVEVTAHASASIPTGENAPDPAGLSIDKTVDVSQAAPGDVVTYTLKVRNTGPGMAEDVVATDALPSGVSFVSASAPCTESGHTATCQLGTLGSGETATITIKVEVDAIGGGDTSHQHQFDITKIESHLSLFDGDTTRATTTCPTGYVATDGSVRMDHVDQGTGTFEDAVVLASGVTADGRGWTGLVRNDAYGQVQAKVNVVCMSEKTVSGEDHSHPVVVAGPVASTQSFTAGRHDIDLECGSGRWAITPSFVFTAGEGTVNTRRTPGGGWRFDVDVDDDAQGTFSVHCLATALGGAQGHSHDLRFSELSDTVTVPAGQVVEVRLTCAGDEKGIVSWADMDPGLVTLGNDPQPVTRVFRFYNPTGSALSADYGLLCVAIRTNGGSSTGGDVKNTASVSTSSPDATTADDKDSATFTVNATGVAVAAKASVVSSGGTTQVRLAVKSSGKRSVTIKLLAVSRISGSNLRAGSLLAQDSAQLRNGKGTVRLVAKGAAVKALRSGKVVKARLVITTRDGRKDVRIVTVQR